MGGKKEQELCDMQQLVSGPGWCDPYHYARPQIMEELKKRLIQPEMEIMEKTQKVAQKLFVNSRSNVITGCGNATATTSENAIMSALKNETNVTAVAQIQSGNKQYVYP